MDRWENLERYETPKERVRRYFWDTLSLCVICIGAWHMAVWGIRAWKTGGVLAYVTIAVLAIVVGRTLQLAFRAGKFWWPLALALLAFAAPITLYLLRT